MASASAPIIVLTLNILLMRLTKYVFVLFVMCNFLISCSADSIAADDSLFLEHDVIGGGNDGKVPPPPPGP